MFKSIVGDKGFYKRVYAIMLPLMIQTLVTNFVNMLDNLMVGQLGTEAMNAVSIGSQQSLLRRNFSKDYSGFKEIMPWEDTVIAINELGTLIDDLQKQGDYAIEKWSL